MAVLSLRCCTGSFLVVASGGYSVIAGYRLLTVVASLITEHRLEGTQACSLADGIFLDQGWNLCLLHWHTDSLPLGHQGGPVTYLTLVSLSRLLAQRRQ